MRKFLDEVATVIRFMKLRSQCSKHSPLSLSGLVDEQQKVRTITALAIAALAEAATPYGIESFDSVLKTFVERY